MSSGKYSSETQIRSIVAGIRPKIVRTETDIARFYDWLLSKDEYINIFLN